MGSYEKGRKSQRSKGSKVKGKGKNGHRSNGSKVGEIERVKRVKGQNHRGRKEWKHKVEYLHSCTASHNAILELCRGQKAGLSLAEASLSFSVA